MEDNYRRFTVKSEENRFTLCDYNVISEVPGDEDDMHQYAINVLARFENIMEKFNISTIDELEAYVDVGIYTFRHDVNKV